ncbi:MAG TPA: hypothetical protein VIY48_17475 [Candidatus Paceibacterota bacterium]
MDHSTLMTFATEYVGKEVAKDDEWLSEWTGWSGVEVQFAGERRWGTTYRVVLQAPDGTFWAGCYSVGNEGSEGSYSDETSTLRRVYPRTETIIVYE